jgi:Fe-S-cluster-containing hydrogenase component 2
MVDLIGALESKAITVHQDRCCLVRNRNADCLRCAEVCTSNCIVFDGEELHINSANCIGCGTCATACPTCALEAHNPNDAQLMHACHVAREACGGTVVIACGQILAQAAGLYEPDAVVRVECLGRVEEVLLTTLVAQGAAEIVLAHGECQGCPHATGRAMLERVLESERTVLDAWGAALPVRVTDKLPACVRAADEGFDKGKRAALEGGGQKAAAAGLAAVDLAVKDALGGVAAQNAEGVTGGPAHKTPAQTLRVMADGTLPHFIPDRRERLLDALATIGEPEDVMINTRLWGHVIIDTEKCKSCRMCAVFCPTGALRKFEREDGTFGVEHYPGDCVKCHTCQSICPAHSLEISEEVFAKEMLAGKTDEYIMKPLEVEIGQAHTIWNKYKQFANIKEVYER